MALILEIEHLLGIAFAASGPDSPDPDWPPQPDRVFSALVAAWAGRGERRSERQALEWLEEQDPPLIRASSATARPALSSFVPPNDKLKVTANPAWRTRQPRRFPAALPYDPTVRFVWPEAHEAPTDVLDALARDVAYVGHSASLTRCRFSDGDAGENLVEPARRIYRGRLSELESAFHAGDRPSPGASLRAVPVQPLPSHNSFSPDWLTFEIVSGQLDLRAAPMACKALIKTVMSGYEAAAGRDAVPEWVSGHQPNGAPSTRSHLAAVPLAFAGFEHADGSLMGFALAPPAGRDDLMSNPDFRRSLLNIAKSRDDDRRIVRLVLGGTGVLDLALCLDVDHFSLNPRRYTGAARVWATVTPLVLDRHLKERSGAEQQDEIEALIAEACSRSIGVVPKRAVAGKHASVKGAPSAYPSGNAPRWTGWRVPEALSSRRLTHAVIEFEDNVGGPVLIGAGRYSGLGLCLPLSSETP